MLTNWKTISNSIKHLRHISETHGFTGRIRARDRDMAKLIDRLIQRKEFTVIWAMKWSEWLMVKTTNNVSQKSMFLYSTWLSDKIARNVPLGLIRKSTVKFGRMATDC